MTNSSDYDPKDPNQNPFLRRKYNALDQGQGARRRFVYDLVCMSKVGLTKHDVLKMAQAKYGPKFTKSMVASYIDGLQHFGMIVNTGKDAKRQTVYMEGPNPFDEKLLWNRQATTHKKKHIREKAKKRAAAKPKQLPWADYPAPASSQPTKRRR